jgi:RNA recognition motif-containing protein
MNQEEAKEEYSVAEVGSVENDNCNLIVNYLPLSYRERHLLKLFSQIGEIKSCRVMRFVQDGRTLSKGYGFVKFSKLEEAHKAIETLNGKNVLGKQIKVSFARPNSQRTKSNLSVQSLDGFVGFH